MFKRKMKKKMLNVRISEEEFRILWNVAERYGFDSLSDFVRVALQQLAANPHDRAEQPLGTELQQINTRMDELEGDLKRLMSRVTVVGR